MFSIINNNTIENILIIFPAINFVTFKILVNVILPQWPSHNVETCVYKCTHNANMYIQATILHVLTCTGPIGT